MNIYDWAQEKSSERFEWFVTHTQNNANGNLTIKLSDDKVKSFKKIELAAKWMVVDNAEWLQRNTLWYASFLENTDDSKSAMTELLTEVLNAKRDKAEQIRQEFKDSTLDEAYKSVNVTASLEHNDCDRKFLTDLVFCDEDQQFYSCHNGSYTAIGSYDTMHDKYSLDRFVQIQRPILSQAFYKTTEKRFELWPLIHIGESVATSEFFRVRDILQEAKNTGSWPTNKFQFMGDTYKDLETFEGDNRLYGDNWIDVLHATVVKHIVDKDLPATLFSRKLAEVKRVLSNGVFVGYRILPVNKQCTLAEFYSELFQTSIADIIPHITNVPHICSDIENRPAKFHLKANWRDMLTDQKPLDECKGLSTFLAPYSDDEKKMLMSWAYTVLHPSCNNSIGLLIKTGGEAFKSNLYAKQIKNLLDVMYGSCHYTIMKDKWVTNEQYCETTTSGFSNSELIFNDECTEKCIMRYKEMSGSTAEEGIAYTIKKVYQVPVSTKIFAKFLFCTNEPFTITDARGVYDRRLAIIDRMDIKNLQKPYKPEELSTELRRELLAFHDLAETYYKEVVKDYGTVENFARTSSINKNLKAVYNEEAKQFAYDQLLGELEGLDGSDDVQIISSHGKGQYNATSKIIRQLTEKIAPEMDLNPKGFRNFLLEVNTELQNDGPKTIKIGGSVKYGYILHNRK